MQSTRTIIIPAYNEEHRIAPTLELYGSYFHQKYGDAADILVVLNGCVDGTESVVQESMKTQRNIQYINIPEAIGKGGAIIEGLKAATGELVGYTDADGSTSPETLDRLFITLDATSTVDCVVGSRWAPGAEVSNRSFRRAVMSRIFNWTARLYFALGIKDTQCGAKVLRSSLLPTVLPNLTISNMAFDVNLLVDVRRAGGAILEMPIKWQDDAASTVTSPFRTGVGMFLSLSRLRLLYSPFRFLYPVLSPLSDFLYKVLFGKEARK